MPLFVYNSLTRHKEEFKPIVDGHVGIYVCGPTVYGHSHIGHAKSYVSFDVIVRYLRFLGYKVLYVQNITDVGHLLGETNEGEDRLLRQGKIEQKHPMEIAEAYTRSYFEDMDRLGVHRPDISPRATGHIIEQIEIVKELIEKGFAYEANGSVYFDVSKDKEYGKLSGRNTEEAESGTRVTVKSEKRHPNDFALWKHAEPEHLMRWPSPWGIGFPGWHVECSAMSMKYLGTTFDIHGGGLDNQFPHHECEIAQSECATDHEFARYWMHNNLVTVKGQKMSKSLGNFITLKDAFKKFDPIVIRFFILQSHYRSTLDFSEEAIEASRTGLAKLHNTIHRIRDTMEFAQRTSSFGSAAIDSMPYRKDFCDAMNEDVNTPKAIAVIFDFASKVNELLQSGIMPTEETMMQIKSFFDILGGDVLGIVSQGPKEGISANGFLEVDLLNIIIKVRNEVRSNKLWALSDKIRDDLKTIGIILEDSKEGTTWKRM